MKHIILFSENLNDIIEKKYIGDNCEVVHLFPSRTQKLSTSAPTIVRAKIGRCQYFFMPI